MGLLDKLSVWLGRGRTDVTVLVLGLDNSGKSTLLAALRPPDARAPDTRPPHAAPPSDTVRTTSPAAACRSARGTCRARRGTARCGSATTAARTRSSSSSTPPTTCASWWRARSWSCCWRTPTCAAAACRCWCWPTRATRRTRSRPCRSPPRWAWSASRTSRGTSVRRARCRARGWRTAWPGWRARSGTRTCRTRTPSCGLTTGARYILLPTKCCEKVSVDARGGQSPRAAAGSCETRSLRDIINFLNMVVVYCDMLCCGTRPKMWTILSRYYLLILMHSCKFNSCFVHPQPVTCDVMYLL
ncbi:unnamed protein product [Spodoptera littoralis]|uniref:Uncharacterized protein n=1 Tax=Spodoptera littoralis TaxID=7109 RepID=A0A9P0I3P2_SPOLI|nr:unnamed protein product [Spodoptera littoralis]CAH1640518.1 unnamed protein product [Spodoptera littoralis]